MPSLKDLRNRISSVKSTKKITSAMKMVAAAKLKRAQDNAEKSRPYANKMKDIVLSLISRSNTNNLKFSKTNNKKTVLLIVCSADRGLCGGFNGSIIKHTKNVTDTLKKKEKTLSFYLLVKRHINPLEGSTMI